MGYVPFWQLLNACDYGVPQLRPRFVLVALRPEYAEYFRWPEAMGGEPCTVSSVVGDLMSENGWNGESFDAWKKSADKIAPTIVGGSKRHGGADLGPTRAKRAWAELGVDAMGVKDDGEVPTADFDPKAEGVPGPKLTTAMVARIQGWYGEFEGWEFTGRKTSRYRQIGNAFPPPVAKALGTAIRDALLKKGEPQQLIENSSTVHDPIYKLLRSHEKPLSVDQIIKHLSKQEICMEQPEVELRLNHLGRDFELESIIRKSGETAYSLGAFKAFVGQDDHQRHAFFTEHRGKIS
jgi:DNA (cytosine-5)-methyltransferase 1